MSKSKKNGYVNEKNVEEFYKDIDPQASRVAGSGAGHNKSDVELPRFNLKIECKYNKRTSKQLQGWVEQAEQESLGYQYWALQIHNPNTPLHNREKARHWIVVEDGYFKELLEGTIDVEDESALEYDRDLSYIARRAKDAAKRALKTLEEDEEPDEYRIRMLKETAHELNKELQKYE